MNIEGLFREIQNWAINNDVLLVEADINENKSATATLPNTESNEALFQLIKKLEVKTVIYRKVEFSNETCDYFSKMISQVEDEEIIKRFEKLKTFRGNLLGFAIHFANNGLLFRFSNFLEIAKDFFEVQTVISEIEFENSEDSYEAFPQAKINEYAKELANHINYINLKNRKQRENLDLG